MTWPFGLLSASRPWPCEERAERAIYIGVQEKPDVSPMYGRMDGEGELLYGAALMASGPVEIKRRPGVNGNVVTVVVDIGALGH